MEPHSHRRHEGIIGDNAIELLREIQISIDALSDRQNAFDQRVSACKAGEDAQHTIIMRAFPDGPENHREAHEAMIRASAAQEKFWSELRVDIAKKGIMGVLVIICGLILAGAAAKFGLVVKP